MGKLLPIATFGDSCLCSCILYLNIVLERKPPLGAEGGGADRGRRGAELEGGGGVGHNMSQVTDLEAYQAKVNH